MSALLPGDSIQNIGNNEETWTAIHAVEIYARQKLSDGTNEVTIAQLRTHLDTTTGDMRAAIYDPDGDGKVSAALNADSATTAGQVQGVTAAGATKYYGTDSNGVAGFYALPAGSTGTLTAHAASHASLGSDPLTPDAIGAANATHAHIISGVTGLLSALEAKADVAHTHGTTEISGLGATLSGLQEQIDNINNVSTGVTSVNGYTDAVTLTKSDLGLGSVDNTADTDKPVSISMQAALDAKAASVHTHAAASTSAAGFLSATDKSKLDGIATVAEVNTVASVNGLTGTVVLNAAVVGASAAAHTHTPEEVTSLNDNLNAKMPLLQTQLSVSTTSATLTKNVMNILTSSSAGTYTMPALNDGEWVGVFPRTSGHTVNYDGIRSFWLADGTTATSFTIASDERGMGILIAFGTTYVGGMK